MSDRFLYVDAQNVKAQIHALLEIYPELAEDDGLRLDMLEGETDLHGILARALDNKREAETMVAAIDQRMMDLASRKARYERQAKAMRHLIKGIMESAGQTKITLPEASLSIRDGQPSVHVTDVNALPQGFYHVERKADKARLKPALLAGEIIPGAELVIGETSLTIRLK